MPRLFDTDAISEVMRSRPLSGYLEWLKTIPREEQFISAVCLTELYHGALRAADGDRHLEHIERRLLPAITVLPFDRSAARVYGEIRTNLEKRGMPLPEADLQIAATARYHGLHLVTGNIKHFERTPGLVIDPVLAEVRRAP
ncbi:MAG: type II toxin-antitoxin system VapC family toxin [bacterium]